MPPFAVMTMILLAASPLAYLAGHARLRARRRLPDARWISLAALGIAWIPLVGAVRDAVAGAASSFVVGALSLRADGVSLLLSIAALTLGTLVVLFSGPYLADEPGQEKFYALVMALVGSITGLSAASDLFNLWLWFEAMAVASYLLVMFHRDRPTSLEAGVKYLVQSAAGSILVLLAIALVVAETGEVNLERVRLLARPSSPLLAAGGLFAVGFGVKVALVPLHTWLPDAHAEAPSGISALLSGLVIETALVALLRAEVTLAGVTDAWGPLLIVFGALNMLAGNLLALRQTQIKRLLAFSSVSQVGYMVFGFGVALALGAVAAAEGAFFHLLAHGLMKSLAFLSVGAIVYGLHAAGGQRPLMITDLAGAARRYPLPALALAVAALGLGGLPPLAGFMSKWQIFAAGVATQSPVVTVLVVFAALNSVVSLAYYAPLVNVLYRGQVSEAVGAGRRVPLVMQVPLAALGVATLALGIWPALVRWLTAPAAIAVIGGMGGP